MWIDINIVVKLFWAYKKKTAWWIKNKWIKTSSRQCHLFSRGGGGEKKKVITTCKLKNLHSCLVLTSLGTAACGAVALSWPARNTWPAPPAIGRATAKWETGDVFTTNRKNMSLLNLNLQYWAGACQTVRAPPFFFFFLSASNFLRPAVNFTTPGANHVRSKSWREMGQGA